MYGPKKDKKGTFWENLLVMAHFIAHFKPKTQGSCMTFGTLRACEYVLASISFLARNAPTDKGFDMV